MVAVMSTATRTRSKERNVTIADDLILYAERGDDDAVLRLLKDGADIEARDTEGQTALMRAAASGHKAVAARLIGWGADIDASRADGCTPIDLAFRGGHDALALVMLRRTARRHSSDLRAEAETVVYSALEAMAKHLVGTEWADLLPPDFGADRVTVWTDWCMSRTSSLGGCPEEAPLGAMVIAMGYCVPIDGRGGMPFTEHENVAADPDIGSFAPDDWRDGVRAAVAHEFAHVVQVSVRNHACDADLPYDGTLNDPHGDGWQRIYRSLRCDCLGLDAVTEKWLGSPPSAPEITPR